MHGMQMASSIRRLVRQSSNEYRRLRARNDQMSRRGVCLEEWSTKIVRFAKWILRCLVHGVEYDLLRAALPAS